MDQQPLEQQETEENQQPQDTELLYQREHGEQRAGPVASDLTKKNHQRSKEEPQGAECIDERGFEFDEHEEYRADSPTTETRGSDLTSGMVHSSMPPSEPEHDLQELPNTSEKNRKIVETFRRKDAVSYSLFKQSLKDTGHASEEEILTNREHTYEHEDEDLFNVRPSAPKLRWKSKGTNDAYDEAFMKRKIAEAQILLELQNQDNKDLGVSNRTRISEMIVDKVQKMNMVILVGKPGVGKSFQGLNAMQLLLEDSTDLCLVMSDPNEIEKALDPNKKYIIFIDDMFGGLAACESEMKNWGDYMNILESLADLQKIKVIIEMRKDVMTAYFRRFKFFQEDCIVDLDNELSNEEKVEILKLYQQKLGIPIDDGEAKSIVDTISDDTGIGFPLICKLMQNKSFPEARSIETIKNLFLRAAAESHTNFIVLVMALLSKDKLDISSLSEDENSCFHAVKEHFHLTNITKATLTQEANAYQGTYLKKVNGCFSFVHDTVIEATFLATFAIMPDVLLKFCPVEILTKYMSNTLKNANGDVECLKYILGSDLSPKLTTEDGRTMLHVAAENKNIYVVRYLCDTYKELIKVKDNLGWSAGHVAAKGGDVECLKYLLASGLSPKLITQNGRTMLHVAACHGKIDLVRYLCDTYKELMNVTDNDGLSAGHYAAIGGDVDCLKYILASGLSPMVTSNSGRSILHIAVKYRNINVVRHLCDTYTELINLTNKKGYSAGHYAAIVGDVECLKYILSSGLSPMVTTQDGRTMLHVAADNGNVDLVRYLCDTYKELIKVTDNDGLSVGHYAAQGGDVECLKYILASGLSPMVTSNSGRSMLHLAAQCRNINVVRYMCDTYSELIKLTNEDGYSAGHYAAAGGNVECLKYILASGLSPMVISNLGRSILHQSAQYRNINVVRYLCDTYTELINLTNKIGWSAGHYAAVGGNVKCLKYILASGLSPMVTTQQGSTMLHKAAANNSIYIVRYLCDTYNELINVANNVGWSAGHYAAAGGDVECLKYLLASGLSPMLTTQDGHTMLHVAVANRNIDIVRYVCDTYKELINVTDDDGWSAGHAAAKGGHVECLKYILASGMSPMLTTQDGRTMMHVATCRGKIDLVRYMCDTYPEAMKVTDNDDFSAGHYAAQGGNVECLKYILASGLSPMLTTKDGSTILHVAIYNRNIDLVKYLCDTYKELVDVTDNDGRSAGHSAAQVGDVECLKYLLASGLSPMVTSNAGRSILHEAAMYRNINLVRYLWDTYSELIKLTNAIGWSAGHYAAKGGDVECLKCILASGLSPLLTAKDGRTMLHVAVDNRNIDLVRYLCDTYKELINVTNNHGWSAGHVAAKGGNVECLEYLLASGLSPKLMTQNECTMLHVAACHGKIDLVRYLCNTYPESMKVIDNYGFSAGHSAAQGGDVECLKYILASGLSPMVTSNSGRSILHESAQYRNINLVRYLCDTYSELIKLTNKIGWSAGHYAAIGGDVGCLKYILASGLSPMVTTQQGSTMLHKAAENNSIDIVRYLCDTYNELIKATNNDGWSAGHYAAKGGDVECLKYSLASGLSPMVTSNSGRSILHESAQYRNINLVRYLCDTYSELIKLTNKIGWSAGHYAAIGGDVGCLKYILASGLSPMVTTQQGSTMLHKAAENNSIDIVRYLCDTYNELIKATNNDGWSAGHYAAKGGDVECLKYILASGLSPMVTSNAGSSILHEAAKYRNINLVRYLCDTFTELINLTNKKGCSVGHYAAEGGDVECLKYLLTSGLSPMFTDQDGQTMLHVAVVHWVDEKKNLHMVRYLCETYKELINVTDNDGLNAGHYAAKCGDVECLKCLLASGISPIATGQDGKTMLHVAAANRNIHLVRYLCDTFTELINVTDDDGCSAGYDAVERGDVECLKYLLASGLSPMLTNRRGRTMLHLAAVNRGIHTVRYLCDTYSELLKITDNSGWSTGHYAAKGGNVECLKYILTSGLSPMLTSQDGSTMLHIAAAEYWNIHLVRYLCDTFTELLNVTDNDGCSAGYVAVVRGDVECLKYLLESGLSPMLTNRQGCTLLHVAAVNRDIHMVRYLCDTYSELLKITDNDGWGTGHYAAKSGDIECHKYILASGLSPMLIAQDGKTMLHVAVTNRRIDLVKYLCDTYKEIIKATDENGWSAGHWAAAGGDVECLKYLLASGLAPMLTSKDGQTMLHAASYNRSIDMVRYLCDTYKEIIKVTDNDGLSAGHYAAAGGDVECLKYLLASGLSPLLLTHDGRTMLHTAAEDKSIYTAGKRSCAPSGW